MQNATNGQPERARDTSFLNLFRGVAALWVVIAHCAIWSIAKVDPLTFFEPKKAVDLFMIISGFLMFYTVGESAKTSPVDQWPTWRKFYIRRFLRISPVYYLALAIVILAWPYIAANTEALQARNPEFWQRAPVYLPENQNISPSSILIHLTYLFGLSPTLSFSTMLPDWSLSLEMQFYFALPVIYLLAQRFGTRATSIVVSVLSIGATVVLILASRRGLVPAFEEPSLLLFKLPVFMCGALIYQMAIDKKPANLVIAFGLLVVCLAQYRLSMIFLLALVALFCLYATGKAPAGMRTIARRKEVEFLANSSFAAYLMHGFVITFTGPVFLPWVSQWVSSEIGLWLSFVALVVPVTYAISYVIYHVVEMPGVKLAKAVTGIRRTPAAPMA